MTIEHTRRNIIVSQTLIFLLATASGSVAATENGSTLPAEASPEPVKTSSAAPPAVLDPSKFFGNARAGYMAAKEAPDVCAQLFCYCGCDLTDEHKTLLDCFTSDHGVDCHICQEEALVGLKMKRQGKSMTEIQKAVDIMFQKQYPFDEVSPALKKYRAERLWKEEPTGTSTKTNKTKSKSKNSASKAKAGRVKAGSCCGGHKLR